MAYKNVFLWELSIHEHSLFISEPVNKFIKVFVHDMFETKFVLAKVQAALTKV